MSTSPSAAAVGIMPWELLFVFTRITQLRSQAQSTTPDLHQTQL
jgi:hypothetical protein